MKRYTVWHATKQRDGEASFDRLADALREFDEQCARDDVVEADLLDNADPLNPVSIESYPNKRMNGNR